MIRAIKPYNCRKQLFALFFALASFIFSFAQNPIVTENALPGNPASEWDISGAGSSTLQGFATDISVNKGERVNFKINTSSVFTYTIKIYRVGYYQGNGARLITTLPNVTGTIQPAPVSNATTGIVDCGNWSVSAFWNVPATAVSGVYIARLTSTGNSAISSHIVFIVRDDASTSDLFFQTSDATWQAYNNYGGNSFYVGTTGFPGGHAVKISYNRPFNSRAGGGGGGTMNDWLFNAEYPMIRFLERNGYNISYTTNVDGARRGNLILNHKVFLSVGHDEYWSAEQRTNVEAARNAGVHLAFFSGNEVYWKTRWEDNHRTLVCYKEGLLGGGLAGEGVCGYKCDPSNIWTGLWREGCSFPGTGGCNPENALTGNISWGNITTGIEVPSAYKNLPFWRNTSIASLADGAIATLPIGTLGFECDFEQYPSSYPSGRITLSSTTFSGKTHKLSLYHHASGALVFGAGTVQWSWGLDNVHDRGNAAPSVAMQQATVNLFADMGGVQPATLQPGLIFTTISGDVTAPVVNITSPANGATLPNNTAITISGTASDVGGVVTGVAISFDGGSTWQAVTGTTNWTFAWTPIVPGPATIKVRGVDNSGNVGVSGPSASPSNISVTVSGTVGTSQPTILNLDTKSSTTAATVHSLTGVPAGSLLVLTTTNNTNEAPYDCIVTSSPSLTWTKRTDAGAISSNNAEIWTAVFAAGGSVSVTSNWGATGQASVIYIVTGVESTLGGASGIATSQGAPSVPVTTTRQNCILFACTSDWNGMDGAAKILRDGATDRYYFRDIAQGYTTYFYTKATTFIGTYTEGISSPAGEQAATAVLEIRGGSNTPDVTPPTVTSVSPVNGAAGVAINTTVSAIFNEAMNAATINGTTFELRNPSDALITAIVSYNAGTNTATLTPSASLASSTVYTAKIISGTSGVKDVAGNELASNYSWSFTTGTADLTPPTIISVTPVNGATGVSISTAISAIFSESLNASTVNSSTIELRNASNVPITATVSYNAGTNTATLIPSGALANSAAYTIKIKSGTSGVKDMAGNALANDYSWSFTTENVTTQSNLSIQNTDTKSNTAATIHSLTGVPSGALLVLTTTNNTNEAPYNCIVTSNPSLTWTKRADAGATTSNNAEIWTAAFAAGGSISVTSNWGAVSQASVLYTVMGAESVLGGASGIAILQGAPSVPVTTTRQNSILFGCTSDWNGTDGAARVLRDGATDRFYFRNAAKGYTTYFYTRATTSVATYTEGILSPTGQKASTAVLEIRGSNTPSGPDITAPMVSSVTPGSGSAGVGINTTVSAIFNEAMNPATINGTTVELRNPSNALITAVVSYNAGTNTATLTPSAVLASSSVYTAKIKGGGSGVKDAAGNALASDYTWSFTTGTVATQSTLSIQNTDAKSSPLAATTHSLTGVPAGALLVLTTTNNTNETPYDCIVTSSPSLTWTKRTDAGATGSNNAEIWTAVFAAGGSITVTSNWGAMMGQASVLYTVTGAESSLGGASGIATLQGAPSVSVATTRENSILFGCTSDWNGIDGAARVLRDGAADRFYYRNAADGYTTYFYTKGATSIGTYTEGISSPAGQQAATAILEIRGISTPSGRFDNSSIAAETEVQRNLAEKRIYSLGQNYPNPTNSGTTIQFTLSKVGKVNLSLFDVSGRVVKVLVNGSRDAGTHTVSFNVGSLAKGVYYYRMQAGDFIDVKKLTIQ